MFGITFSGVIFIILLLYGLLSVLVVSFTGRNLFISLKTKEEGLREEKMPIEIIIKNKSSLPVFRSDINIKCKNLLGGEEFEKTINKGIDSMGEEYEIITECTPTYGVVTDEDVQRPNLEGYTQLNAN